MAAIAIVLGVGAAIKTTSTPTQPQQELARALLVPTDVARRVIVPPCGTGVPVTSRPAGALARTPGSVVFVLSPNNGERIVVVPRCLASQGAHPSPGVELPAAAFVLAIGADLRAGVVGNGQPGTQRIESQYEVPPASSIRNIVITRCIEPKEQAQPTGRSVILRARPGRPDTALAPPC